MSDSLDKIINDTKISLAVLRMLADNSFDSVMITDSSKSGKIIYTNKAFTALTGYAGEDVVGKTPRILQGAATDKTVIRRLRKSLENGKRFEGRAINYKKGGVPFIMQWRVVPVKLGKNTKVWLAIQREGNSVG